MEFLNDRAISSGRGQTFIFYSSARPWKRADSFNNEK